MKEKNLLKRIKICGFKSLGTAEQPEHCRYMSKKQIIGIFVAGKKKFELCSGQKESFLLILRKQTM